jgi:hypothetical protein
VPSIIQRLSYRRAGVALGKKGGEARADGVTAKRHKVIAQKAASADAFDHAFKGP